MRVAVSASGKTPATPLDERFGRSPFFIISDIEEDKWECIENENLNYSNGSGTATVQMLSNRGVNVVITGNIGPNAIQALQTAGIKVYTAHNCSVKDALEMYKKGMLQMVSTATTGGHRWGAR